MKLVRIGLKVVEKWGDEKLFVVVESDNSAAIKMYEKLKFSLVLKEEDNINRRMDRVPRIFMSIEVPKKVQVPLNV
jgi:ribosomal protein S18 acetylase RimI-like enzyme